MDSATRLLWLDYWASHVDPNYKYSVIQYEKNNKGYWDVEIKLPHYDKVIKEQSGKLIVAIIAASREACKVINKLMEVNPDLRIDNKYVDGHWVIKVDADGEGYSITQSDEYFNETQETLKVLTEALSNQSQAILHTITRWIGTTKLAYLHIFDKRLFGSDNKEIMKNVRILIKNLHKDQCSARTYISGDSVISFGFKIDIK